MLETFSGDVGVAAGIVRNIAQGGTRAAGTSIALAAMPTIVGKTVGPLLRPLAKAADETLWLNGQVISSAWMNAKSELTWINPLTGAKEVIPATAKVHVDHVLPQNAIKQIEGFDSLPKSVQNEILKDPANLQPMIKSANCSKGCKVEADGAGWATWNGAPVSAEYKIYLEKAQNGFRNEILKIIEANRASGAR